MSSIIVNEQHRQPRCNLDPPHRRSHLQAAVHAEAVPLAELVGVLAEPEVVAQPQVLEELEHSRGKASDRDNKAWERS